MAKKVRHIETVRFLGICAVPGPNWSYLSGVVLNQSLDNHIIVSSNLFSWGNYVCGRLESGRNVKANMQARACWYDWESEEYLSSLTYMFTSRYIATLQTVVHSSLSGFVCLTRPSFFEPFKYRCKNNLPFSKPRDHIGCLLKSFGTYEMFPSFIHSTNLD